MNETDPTTSQPSSSSNPIDPPIFETKGQVNSHVPEEWFSYWLRKFFACNPFYLVSAALLLFGMYRISVDRTLFTEEISQLAFNLGSLEFYEILLVVTAIFLASRRIWYDSTLLVGIQPRRSLGSWAYTQSPRRLRIRISLPGGSWSTGLALSAVARRACTSAPVTMARDWRVASIR